MSDSLSDEERQERWRSRHPDLFLFHRIFEEWAAVKNHHKSDSEALDYLLERARLLVHYAKCSVGGHLSEIIELKAKAAKASGLLNDLEGKQLFVKQINAIMRKDGVLIQHPETGDACVLVVLSDAYGGRFALESRKGRKRTNSTKDIIELLRFLLIPEEAMNTDVMEPDEWATVARDYPEGTEFVGRVREVGKYGAFVTIRGAVEGLIHRNDLGGEAVIPADVLREGQKVRCSLLDFDLEKERVSLRLVKVEED